MTTKATVVYELTADEAKAVDAFRKLSREQQKAAIAFGKTAKAAEQMEQKATRAAHRSRSAISQFGASVKSVMGMLGVGMGGFSLAAAFGGIARGMDEANTKVIAFQRGMTELLSLGDNASNIAEITGSVLDLSTAFRTLPKDVSGFLFALQSGSAGLDPGTIKEIRDESLELSEVTGTELVTSMTALLKTFQIYGDEIASIDELQNKLFIGAERGWMSFRELGELFPDVASSAKTFGYSLNEVIAALAVATRMGGRNEKTFTGVRNIFTRMGKAAEEGVPMVGNLVQDLEQLAALDPDTLKNIFGEEAITVASILRENTEAIADEMQQLSDIQGDLVKQRKELREEDPQYAFAKRMEQIKISSENATVRGGGSEGTRELSLYFEEAKRGWRDLTPSFLHGMPLVEGLVSGLHAGVSSLSGSPFGLTAIGQEAIAGELTRANLADGFKYIEERGTFGKNPLDPWFTPLEIPILSQNSSPAQAAPLVKAAAPAQATTEIQQSTENLAAATLSLVEVVEEMARQQREADAGRGTGHRERVQRITNLNAGVG